MEAGCGKTTLAKHIEEYDPENFKRIIQVTTRPKRDDEQYGVDYNYISMEEYEATKNKMFQRVEYQFSPNKYGSYITDNVDDKWNILIVSIEGFLSSVLHSDITDKQVLLNILIDDPAELSVLRNGREPNVEEKYNKSIINPFLVSNTGLLFINQKLIKYNEILLPDLKKIRNDPTELIKYINNICE